MKKLKSRGVVFLAYFSALSDSLRVIRQERFD